MHIGGRLAVLLTAGAALAACGGGSNGGQGAPAEPAPIDTDYSGLRVPAASASLRGPRDEQEILDALRNGLRLSIGQAGHVFAFVPAVATGGADNAPAYTRTTQQVEGVDEGDLVKYDGTHLFIVRPESVPTDSVTLFPPTTRNVLSILRTDPTSATAQPVSTFALEEEQSNLPLVYALENESGKAEFLAALSHDVRLWTLRAAVTTDSLLPQFPDDVSRIQLLDVRDPYNVQQAWKLEMDGWLRTSRKIGDVLYVVTSFHPRLADIVLPADTPEKREANERRIRAARADELLPGYRIDDGVEQPLLGSADCIVGSELQSFHAYDHLLVVAAIDLRERRIADATCLSTNASGVYVSQSSLYIGGERPVSVGPGVMTVLHKFALADGQIAYEASGTVGGAIGWTNPSYYMDERGEELRILTSQSAGSSFSEHRLSILRQVDTDLALVATLPNETRPSAIGKPGELVHSVRFLADRAYVVTARMIDPFYVIDLSNPSDPFIAGELEIPGFSTYLHPIGASLVASVGRQTTDQGAIRGVKVELFDVSAPDNPRSVGAQVFGDSGSMSEAVQNPHAVTFLTIDDAVRIALPIDVHETPNPNSSDAFTWTYSGLHLLEVQNATSGSPQLHFQGVIRTNEPSTATSFAPYVAPQRGVLHGESVFSIYGEAVSGRLWDELARSPSAGMQF